MAKRIDLARLSTVAVCFSILLVVVMASSPTMGAVGLGSWQTTGKPAGGGILVALADGRAALFPSGGVVQIYHPDTGGWTNGGVIPEIPLTRAIQLGSGQVLLMGANCALYDPATGTVTPTGSVNVPRSGFSATLLASGKVLVSGGRDAGNDFVGPAELYDPVTGLWSFTGSLNQVRSMQLAERLPNGKVLVAGGTGQSGSLASAELYDPASGSWTPASAMSEPRSPAVGGTLHDGRVLVVGFGSSSVYDSVSNTWSPDVEAQKTSTSPTLVVLHDGPPLLVAFGGIVPCSIPFAGCPVIRTHLYDAQADAWISAASPNFRGDFSMVALADGRALLMGGAAPQVFSVSASPRLEVSPTSADFGSTNPGVTVQVAVTLQNTGASALTGHATTSAPFAVVAGSPFTLPPGESVGLTVSFTAPGVGSFVGTLELTSNANPISIPLQGQGPTGPRLSGRVTDATGAGVAGVSVALTGGQSGTIVTDAEGRYQFFVAENNGYNLTPSGASLTFTPGVRNVIVGTQHLGGLDFVASLPPEQLGVFRGGLWFKDVNGNGQWDGCGASACLDFGLPDDKPVPADWSGTGKAKAGVFRDGIWSLDFNGNGQWDGCAVDRCPTFGLSGDDPVASDWTGRGHASIGVFRGGAWYLDLDGNGQWDGCVIDACFGFGMAGDVPIAADWTGSGRGNIGVFRDGAWYLDLNGNGQWDGCAVDACFSFGQPGDVPVVGDWTGSGLPRIGVFRNGSWFLDLNGNGVWDGCGVDGCFGFGLASDRGVVGRW